jgi:uncharacterized membrane protein YbhN (UPF0104 family)
MTVTLDVPTTRPRGRAAIPGAVARRSVAAGLRHGRFVLGVAGTVVLLAVVLPAVAGIPWSGIAATLVSVSAPAMVGLVALWAGGLALHTIALTAALPGLSARRAATLSLTGSAVANVLPVGGAAGVALNYRMAQTWGFDARAMTRFTVVTNVWDVLAKVALPVVALPLLVVAGIGAQPLLVTGVTAVVGALVLGAVAVVLVRPTAAARVGRAVDRVVARVRHRSLAAGGSGTTPSGATWEHRMSELQAGTIELVRRRWGRLSLGMALYTAALLGLMVACFAAAGAGLPLGVVLTAFVLERLLTLAGLTPGGAGVVEVAVTGLLVSLGAAAGTAAAGILLYRGLTMALEVPVGGTWLLAWASMHVHRRRRAAPAATIGTDA